MTAESDVYFNVVMKFDEGIRGLVFEAAGGKKPLQLKTTTQKLLLYKTFVRITGPFDHTLVFPWENKGLFALFNLLALLLKKVYILI